MTAPTWASARPCTAPPRARPRVQASPTRTAAQVVPGESCSTGSSAIAGVDFYSGSAFGPAYANALFFADYVRDCIWVIPAGASSPNPAVAVRAGSGEPELHRGRPRRRPLLHGSRRRPGPADRGQPGARPPAWRRARPAASCRSASASTARAPATPTSATRSTTPGTSTGTVSTTTRAAARPQRTYPSGGHVHRRPARDRRRRRHRHRVGGHPGAGVASPDLVVRTLKVRIPDSRKRLIARGGKAKLRCNVDCRATLTLVAKGADAKRIGIRGRIAKGAARLDAGVPGLGGREADRPGRGATAARRPGPTAEGRRPGRRPAALTQSSQPKQSDR